MDIPKEVLKKIYEDLETQKQKESNAEPATHQKTMTGWLCPRCGRGLSPFASYCPCVPIPMNPYIVTCYSKIT